jgi:cysteine desulfurase
VRFVGVDAEDLLARLQPDLCASTGSACTSGVIGVSHVLSALGLTESEALEGLRLSLGRFTTEAEIDLAARLIAQTLKDTAIRAA